MNNKTVIVTGGSGYIGAATCVRLVEKGFNVINVDKVKREIPGVALYPFGLESHQMKGLISLSKPDAILHIAATPSVPKSFDNPRLTYTNNVANTLNLLDVCLDLDLKNIVFASSSSVYGNEAAPQRETSYANPVSPYGHSKLFIEDVLVGYGAVHDLNYIALRYFNVTGSIDGDYGNKELRGVVSKAVKAALKGETFTINGNDFPTASGTTERDYTHLVDVVEANVLAVEKVISEKIAANINIASGDPKSVLDVIQMVEKLTGKEITVETGERRMGDPTATHGIINRAKELLDWEPTKTFEDMVKDEISWQTKASNHK